MKKFVLHILLAAVYLNCDVIEKIPVSYRDEVAFFSKRVNIIGDSLPALSNGFNLQEKMGPEFLVTDFSMKNTTMRDWLGQTHRAMAIRPEIIILELGTNDALQFGTAGYEETLFKLITEIKSNTAAKIYLTAVPPTNIEGVRQSILENNKVVRKFSIMYKVIDLESLFYLNGYQRYYSPLDSLHPNKQGMDLIGDEYTVKIGF